MRYLSSFFLPSPQHSSPIFVQQTPSLDGIFPQNELPLSEHFHAIFSQENLIASCFWGAWLHKSSVVYCVLRTFFSFIRTMEWRFCPFRGVKQSVKMATLHRQRSLHTYIMQQYIITRNIGWTLINVSSMKYHLTFINVLIKS